MLIKEFNKKSGKYDVTFRIPCEQLPADLLASQINIVASFNNWSISENPMSVADGVGFEAKVKLKPGRYEFRYLINDHVWYNDWEADGYEPNRLQNADNCIIDLAAVGKAKKAAAKQKAAPKSKAKATPTKKGTKGDDLKKIEGIGPKISGLLNEAGISTFAQLAELSIKEIREILTGKVRIFHPDTWPKQAGLAAKGDWKGLEKLQDKLVGGRKA